MKAWLEEIICGNYQGEPHWRIAAYWFVIVAFFGVPLATLVIHLFSLFTGVPDVNPGEFSYLTSFQHTLVALFVSILGLNSFDKWKTNGKASPPPVPEAPKP